MNVHYTYSGNHVMMYESQIIMLYTFNLYKMTENVDSQALWLWRLNVSEIGQHPEADVACVCVCVCVCERERERDLYFGFERLEQVFMFSQKNQ